jgi:uncharacterized repeat protein (TIGR01451 family)
MDESYLEWLTSIPGSDAERARRIAQRFPTYDQLRAATREELASVDGLTAEFVEALRGLLGGSSQGEEAEHLFLCPECGSFVGTATTTCPFCGVTFGESTESHLAAAFDEFLGEESPGRLCVACGAGMGGEETACPVCGRQYGPTELALLPGMEPHLDESAPFCSRCGAYLSSAESECAICGSSMTPGREAAPAAKGVVKDFLTRWQRIAPADALASEADRLAEELVHFDRLLEANPTLERAWANRAKVLEKLGRTKEAAESLEKAAELNPAKEDRYRLEVQNILKTTNDAAVVTPRWTQPAATAAPKVLDPHLFEALDHYESLLRADPSLIVAWRTQAEILDRLGRADESRLSLAEADRLEHVDLHSARAAVDGLQSTGLATSGPGRTGRTNGQVNGTRNGRTNGRVNGVAEGRVNGLTTGAANGLTFGRGATNGLVNGNGFTNGRRGRHPIPRIPPQPHWSRSVVGIAAVVALMVIVPILASLLSPAPTGGGPLIRIDGNFGDWARFPAYMQSPADPTPNPAVHLLAVKVVSQDRDLFVYAKVQGLMFQGTGVSETDSIFAFVDEDNSRTTGYPIGDLGADSLVEITGWRDLSTVRHQVTSYVFNETGVARSNDWNRFLPSGSAEAAFTGSEIEIRVTVRDAARARVLVYAADNLGNFDPSDGSIRASLPTVIIGQQTVAKDIVASARVPFLRLTLAPMGGVPHVSAVNISRLGTSSDPVDLALYRDNGSGVFNATAPLLATATMTGKAARFNVSQDLSGPALYWVETRWATRTSTRTFGLAVADVATNGTASFRPPETTLVYLGAAPSTPQVDGAFGDWQGRPYGQDPLGDVRNLTGAISPIYDANIDILATAVHVAANFTGYVRVDGRMLGGQDIPTVRVRTSPLPPANNTTIQNPIPPQEGVDIVYAYIDSDNSTTTGLRATVEGRQYGFDYAIAIVGRNGEIRSHGLYAYVAGSAGPWKLIGSAAVGFDAHRMEFAVNASVLNLTAGYQVVYYTSDWRLQYDVALPTTAVAQFPVSVQAATNVLINEVSSRSNPEWIEIANPLSSPVSLSGWTLVRVKGNGNTVLFSFTNEILGAWGSGAEYLQVLLPGKALPNGGATVALLQAGTEVDRTTYPGSLSSVQSWSRHKDPQTGVPWDFNYDPVDFYTSAAPSPGKPNDQYRPTIVLAKTANRAVASPGDTIIYTLYYNNTDIGMAKRVWINDTLPSGVAYVSSSVAYTSAAGSTYRWLFTNVWPGSHSFTLTVQVTAGTASGQVLGNTATLDYTDQLGRPFPLGRAWANTTVSRPTINIVKTANPSSAKAGDLVTFTIYYNNTGSAPAGTVSINDSLPVGMDYQSATPAPTWTNGRTFYWNFTNVAPGPHSLTLTARVNASFSGTQLVNWAFLNYTTAGGYALSGGRSSVIVAIPELSDMLFVAAVPLVILGLKFRARRRQKE